MLSDSPTISFVPSTDIERSRAFYGDVLGLELRRDDGFALVFDAGARDLRVVDVGELTPQPFTIIGWAVIDIAATAAGLAASGVEPIRYGHFEQDDLGIWTAPGGDRVAWFTDPDGNILSITSTVDG